MKFAPCLAPLLTLAALVASPAQAASVSDIETVFVGDNDFIESMLEAPDGSIYFSSAFKHQIGRVGPNGRELIAELPQASTLVMARLGDHFVVTGQDKLPDFSHMQDPAAWSNLGNRLTMISYQGKILGTKPSPAEWFFNGVTQLNRNVLLIAGQNQGTIFSYDARTGEYGTWLKHELIMGKNNTNGINGIQYRAPWVYYTNAGQDGTFRVRVGANGKPAGVPEKVFDKAGDDFAVAPDGTVYLPNGDKIYRIRANGQSDVFLDGVGVGAYALVTRNGQWLYWSAHGRSQMMPKAPGESKIFRIRLKH